jgi:hypothetical protein
LQNLPFHSPLNLIILIILIHCHMYTYNMSAEKLQIIFIIILHPTRALCILSQFCSPLIQGQYLRRATLNISVTLT